MKTKNQKEKPINDDVFRIPEKEAREFDRVAYYLHYASIFNNGDIPCYEFPNKEETIDFCNTIVNKNITDKSVKKVYTLFINEEIFITKKFSVVLSMMKNLCLEPDRPLGNKYHYHLHEYDSYETALSIAHDYLEGTSLFLPPNKN